MQFGAKVVEQRSNGKTGAIKTALEKVNTPFLLVMDGDYTYDPSVIHKFLENSN
jgi:cellulose synthase/poly-beta-1,6-N-acetylglucosamine synthase-like glycosyltransferase